jgi:hypothetical protein
MYGYVVRRKSEFSEETKNKQDKKPLNAGGKLRMKMEATCSLRKAGISPNYTALQSRKQYSS